jgi:hypothetical protein
MSSGRKNSKKIQGWAQGEAKTTDKIEEEMRYHSSYPTSVSQIHPLGNNSQVGEVACDSPCLLSHVGTENKEFE